MSYEPRQTLGSAALDNMIKCGSGIVGTAVGGVADPYLPEVLCRVQQLQAMTKGRTPLQILTGKKPVAPIPPCKEIPLGRKSIGVDKAIKPLRTVVYVGQNPHVVWLGAAAIVGVPLLLGYMLGRGSR